MPQNVKVISVNATSLQVQWNPILSSLTNGLIVSYSINVTEIESGIIIDMINVSQHTFVIGNLHPYYNYKISVAGSTVIGTGPYAHSEGQTNAAG